MRDVRSGLDLAGILPALVQGTNDSSAFVDTREAGQIQPDLTLVFSTGHEPILYLLFFSSSWRAHRFHQP